MTLAAAKVSDPWLISYGSFTFPLYSRSNIQGRPVPDSSRRSVMFVQYTLEIESYLCAGPQSVLTTQPGEQPGELTLDDDLIQIRQQLSQRGAMLEIKNTGFGHVRVNNPLGIVEPGVDFADVAYGPHPEILDAKTIAGRA